MAKLMCLCLLAVAAAVVAHEAQTLPGKGGRYSGVQTLPGNLGSGGRGQYGGGGIIPPRKPQVQPRPGGQYKGKPGNNLKPIGRRPIGSSTRPFDRPPHTGQQTQPRPRPSKGGERFRRSHHDSDESDEDRRYRRQVDEEPVGDEEYEYVEDDEEYDEE